MKYLIYILILVATILAIYNISLLNFDNLLVDDSKIALYSLIGCACAIVLLLILLLSYKIKEKVRQ